MADNKIHFSISSSTDTDGFKALNNSIKSAGKTTKDASGIFKELLSEASKSDDTFGKVAGSIGNVATAFSQMGVAGGVLYTVKEGAELLANKLHEMAEEYDKVWQNENAKIEAQNMQMLNAKVVEVKSSLSAIKDVALANSAAFDTMCAAAMKMAQAVAQVTAGSNASTVSQLLIDQFNASLQAESEASAKLAKVKYDVAIAEELESQVRSAESEKVRLAQVKLSDALNAQDMATQNVTMAQQALVTAQNAEAFARQKFGEKSQEYLDAHQRTMEAQNLLTQAQKTLTEKTNLSELAEVEKEAAIQNQTAAINKAILNTEKAIQAEDAMIAQQEIKKQLENNECLTKQQTNEILNAYNQAIQSGISAQTAKQQAEQAIANYQQQNLEENIQAEEIKKDLQDLANATQQEFTDVQKMYKEALDEGLSAEDAYNKAVEECTEAMNEKTKKTKEQNEKLGKDDKENSSSANASVSVDIDPSQVGKGNDSSSKIIKFSDIQDEIKKTQDEIKTSISDAKKGADAAWKCITDGKIALTENSWKIASQKYGDVFAKKAKEAKWGAAEFKAVQDQIFKNHMLTKKQQDDVHKFLNSIYKKVHGGNK